MSRNYDLSALNSNTFYRIFRGELTLDIYLESLGTILSLCDPVEDTIAIITDYRDCAIKLSEQEFSVVSNYMRLNFISRRLVCAVVATSAESIEKLYIWREELIRHGTILFGKVFGESVDAMKYVEETLEGFKH